MWSTDAGIERQSRRDDTLLTGGLASPSSASLRFNRRIGSVSPSSVSPAGWGVKNVAMMQKNVRSVSDSTLFQNKKPQ
jgi:hypothetical protein